jgi:hypothetical protein
MDVYIIIESIFHIREGFGRLFRCLITGPFIADLSACQLRRRCWRPVRSYGIMLLNCALDAFSCSTIWARLIMHQAQNAKTRERRAASEHASSCTVGVDVAGL